MSRNSKITIRIEDAIYDGLKQAAHRADRSLAYLVNDICKQWLDRQPETKPDVPA